MILNIEILPIHDITDDKTINYGHVTLCRNCKDIISKAFDNIVFCSERCKIMFINQLENSYITPADICKRCGHYSPIVNTFTCKHNGNSVEYEGEENEDCSLYIPHNKNDGDEYYG